MTQEIRDFLLAKGALSDASGALRWREMSDDNQQLSRGGSMVAWLQGFSVVSITGGDARAFLQGQLTNDVFALTANSAQWQGYCQPQGRLLASFPLVCENMDSFWVILPTSITAAIAKRLSMFVLRSKVRIEVSTDAALGFCRSGDDHAIRVGVTPLFVKRVSTTTFPDMWGEATQACMPASERVWMLASIQAGVGIICAGAQDLFVPQMIGWDVIGVNYKKGCYPGQEVVARAHYRGAVKRKPVRVRGEGVAPSPGTALIRDDQEFGHLVAPAQLDETHWLSLGTLHQDVRAEKAQPFDGLGLCQIEAVDVAA
jgi:tRNA-modifying protein YgfZ